MELSSLGNDFVTLLSEDAPVENLPDYIYGSIYQAVPYTTRFVLEQENLLTCADKYKFRDYLRAQAADAGFDTVDDIENLGHYVLNSSYGPEIGYGSAGDQAFFTLTGCPKPTRISFSIHKPANGRSMMYWGIHASASASEVNWSLFYSIDDHLSYASNRTYQDNDQVHLGNFQHDMVMTYSFDVEKDLPHCFTEGNTFSIGICSSQAYAGYSSVICALMNFEIEW